MVGMGRTAFSKKTLSDYVYLILFMIALGEGYTLRVIFNKIASYVPFGLVRGTTLMYTVFGILFLLKFGEMFKNLQKKKAVDVPIIFFVLLFSVLYVYSFKWDVVSLYVETGMLWKVMLVYIPVYIIARSITDYEGIRDKLWIAGCVIFLFSLYVVSIENKTLQDGYDTQMTIGYQFGLCSLIFFDKFRQGRKRVIGWILLGLGVVSAYYVVAVGSRGTFLMLLFYFAYLLAREMKWRNIRLSQILLLLAIAFCIFFGDIIIGWLQNVLFSMGLESRTLSWLFQTDSNLGTSGRDVLYKKSLEAIGVQPFFGYGLWGDRVLLNNMYVHNLFLELCIDFGVVVGVFVSTYIVISFFRALFVRGSAQNISILAIYGMFPLMMTGSYLSNTHFWLALGIVLSIKDTRVSAQLT